MIPLLSIAIPTHNRAKYAIHAIRSILAISDERLEIVVSDTSTDGELQEKLNKLALGGVIDPRLKYFRPVERLDMTGNHNKVLSAVTGEYVCLIGDDDSITKEAVLAAAWASKNRVEVIAPNVVANYVWPDFRCRFFGDGHASRLYIAKHIGGASHHDSSSALSGALLNAAQGTDRLPKIYHGIVKRSTLERLKDASGAYFHGSSPDVSGAIGLALCSKSFIVTDYPLTIPGASGGSNTGRSAMNKHKGKLEEETQTKGFKTAGWSQGVPKFFSVETVWAHAALETIARIAPEHVSKFNFEKLIGVCRVLHPEYASEIDHAILEVAPLVGRSFDVLEANIVNEMKLYKRARILHVLKRLMKPPTAARGRTYVSNLDTIAAAPAMLEAHMVRHGLKWDQVENNFVGR